MSDQAQPKPSLAAFGANAWLVDEMYEEFVRDKDSVDPAWWDFFEDYRPGDRTAEGSNQSAADTKSTDTAPPDSNAATKQPAQTPQQPQPAAQPTPAPQESSKPAPVTNHSPVLTEPAPAPSAQPTQAPYAAQVARMRDKDAAADDGDEKATPQRLRGAASRVVKNMEVSLSVPTATSVRAIPAKLLVDNRIVINNHLARGRGGKVSFTHLIGFALVEAADEMPAMNVAYAEVDGKPGVLQPNHVNLGLAIDLPKPDGTRQLLVPNVKASETMDFAQFWASYEDMVRRARNNKLTVEDFAETTMTLTNPGTIGTVHSVPRLMQGQGAIIGVGAMDYPAEFQGASAQRLAEMGISKILTLTSTYDHRVIQGADSGEFLRIVHAKLLGEDGFYDRIFAALQIPYEPIRWVRDRKLDSADEVGKPARIIDLIHAYRTRGHLMADVDPLTYMQRGHPDLDVQTYGLNLWDLDREFPTGGFGGKSTMLLRDVLGLLRDSYCRTIGVEYMHISDPEQRRWLQERLEGGWQKPERDEQLRILRRLNAAEAFETFLQTKYVGQKRFSLEGGESLIPLLDAVLTGAAESGLDEVTIGMAHRGRLNVLANLAGKSYSQIFREFEGNQDPRSVQGSGDVKYHLGTEGTYTAESGAETQVYLAANPSHLEAVNSVLEGITRAKQDRIDLGGDGFSVLPVLIHGDAAFAGQGVVTETLNLSQLRGYRTGGTVHVIVNNQVGFTTGPAASRSSTYSTDVALGYQLPVFHVNGDDPEACVAVAKLAFEYRERFNKDVVIDMICYRRRGHNEGDDPSMTQPLMYSLIEAKRSTRKLYTEALIGRGDITVEEAEQALRDYQQQLERVFTETRQAASEPHPDTEAIAGLERPESQREDAGMMVGWSTAVDQSVIERIGEAHVNPPAGFSVHPKLEPMLKRRHEMSKEGGIDWGFGELLAFGSLLLEGTPVRLAGQDSRRGTFVQRHSVLHDRRTGAEWTPLLYLSADQAKFWVYDSSLSEYAAQGFEYGYSVERPDALVLWEAQFGDFVNGAQTIIDEFISSAEQKWGQRSSVVLLLPHGYEGQGPDHSSARPERFLQMCAENNMIVAQPSNPASYFHLLRRQAYARPRVPLVVFTPKWMLRLRAAASAVEDFTQGTFEEVLPDTTINPANVKRVLLCSGKIYWELIARREADNDTTTAIVRLEQLYPLASEKIAEVLQTYGNAELIWVQDEPENQGPWPFITVNLAPELGREIKLISRPASAATSTGTVKAHQIEQTDLLNRVFPN
ncbi:MAG TPA: multifunctional oxoglutarate decarboxylase/oxoglutarate dehydrogenase thiamine pyrophosphate-binding subunit/dihydrolipoyllysine-residue succinyltransferase subunit [Actinomycetales bacterium]|nr:multifunctional oxoglutarate decarboxylase/oxoglutarate dehydrogenase thiamine pyrophosphate-binding subunit/dihydrolipoyllysine-residue succinyltransferase subunit [Actinomycetales bacterium]